MEFMAWDHVTYGRTNHTKKLLSVFPLTKSALSSDLVVGASVRRELRLNAGDTNKDFLGRYWSRRGVARK